MPSTRINLLQIALITFDLFVHFLQLVRFLLNCIYGTQAATGDKVAGLRPSILLKIRLAQVFSYEFWENCLPTPKLTLIQTPNPNQGTIFLKGNCLIASNPKTNPTLGPNSNPNRGGNFPWETEGSTCPDTILDFKCSKLNQRFRI